jgi:hypothetical protein
VKSTSLTELRLARTVVIGALLGLVILGIGGRAAMAYVAVQSGGSPSFTLGGTLTVIALGTASGLAGAVMALASRWAASWLPTRMRWLQHVLLAALLALVTARGLRGTHQPGTEWFWALVGVYGVALAWLTAPRPGSVRGPTPLAPEHPG